MTEEEIENFDFNQITEEDGPGFIFEVDLHYPEDLHLQHNSFPLAPESVNITEDDLSEYSFSCLQEVYKKNKHKAKKLISTFRDRCAAIFPSRFFPTTFLKNPLHLLQRKIPCAWAQSQVVLGTGYGVEEDSSWHHLSPGGIH